MPVGNEPGYAVEQQRAQQLHGACLLQCFDILHTDSLSPYLRIHIVVSLSEWSRVGTAIASIL